MTVSAPARLIPVPRIDEAATFALPRLIYVASLGLLTILVFRPALGTTASDWLGFLALGLAVLGVVGARGGGPGWLPAPLLIGAGLYLFGGLISSFQAEAPVSSLGVLLRFGYLVIAWFWLGSVVLRTVDHVRLAAFAWVLSAGLNGAAALVQLAWGDVVPGTSTTPFFGRMVGLTGHPNDLGAICAIALPVGLLLPRLYESRLQRVTALGAVTLVVAGLLLSGSVGSFLAAAVGIGTVGFVVRPSARVIVFMTVLLAVATAVVSLQGDYGGLTPGSRINQVTSSEGSVQARLRAYEAALIRIDSNPLVGVGPAPGGARTSVGSQVHNAWLGAWFESGLLGLLGLSLVTISGVVLGLQVLRNAIAREERLLAGALVAAFLACLTYGLGAPVLFQRYGWVSLALIVALTCIQRSYALTKQKPGAAPERSQEPSK